MLHWTVAASQAGIRLEDFLAQILEGGNRTRVRRAILAGEVQVNRFPGRPQQGLRAGDYVELAAEPQSLRRAAPRQPLPAVLVATATALVIDKPSGLPTVPDRFHRGSSVHAMLATLAPGADLRIVHRLDRDTSGCLVLGKGLAAAQHFDRQFRDGRVHKEYLALVQGVVGKEPFVIDHFLGPDPRRPGKVVASRTEKKGYRAARTEVTCEAAFAEFTWLRLRPRTGRGHQLRVHLRAIGHPIVGDTDYGGEPLLLSRMKRGYKPASGDERPLLARLCLHAERVQFADLDGSEVTAAAPLPEDLAAALARLAHFAPERR